MRKIISKVIWWGFKAIRKLFHIVISMPLKKLYSLNAGKMCTLEENVILIGIMYI